LPQSWRPLPTRQSTPRTPAGDSEPISRLGIAAQAFRWTTSSGLVAFFRILLAHANHVSKNLDVEAVALGFEKDFLLRFGELFDFSLDVLDPLYDRPQLITRNDDWSADGLLLVNLELRNFAILAAISRRTSECGDQPVNGWRA
jgi:hypothetical protein